MKTKTPHQQHPLSTAINHAIEFRGLEDWFEVFETGEQTDSRGRSFNATADVLDSIVANHEPAPLVVGHPKDNHPAYGWTAGLKREGEKLLAKASDVPQEFSNAVQSKHFPKRSISIASDGNGGYKLRHVGFLGAVPPAVPGLKDIDFSTGNAEQCFEFAALGSTEKHQRTGWGFNTVAHLFRRLRDNLIAKDGLEAADQLLPEYEVEHIRNIASDLERDDDKHFSQSTDNTDNSNEDDPMPGDDKNFSQADLDDAVAEKTQTQTDEIERLKSLLEQKQFNARVDSCNTLISDAVNQGKLLPAQVTGLAEFMASLSDGEDAAFEFSAADSDAPQKQTPFDFAKSFIEGLGKQIELGRDDREEPRQGQDAHSFNAPVGTVVDDDRAQLHQRICDFASENKLDYATAAAQIEQ